VTKLENCWSIGEVRTVSSGNINTGGLIGYSDGNSSYYTLITQCWTNSNVITENSGTSEGGYIGGLVGRPRHTDIEKSWASGNVSSKWTGAPPYSSQTLFTGGLAGHVEGGSITNCYALGSVTADITNASNTSIVYTGGLVGYLTNTASNVQYNFASGSVSGRTNGSGAVYSGGIVGYNAAPSIVFIQNNAALGVKVTAAGPGSTKRAMRIFGYPTTNSGSRNYANGAMEIGTANSYNGSPSLSTVSANTDPDRLTPNGKNAVYNDFRRMDFWLDTAGLSFNYDDTLIGINKFLNIWDFSTLAGRGYPQFVWEQ
jgi:hypothetical protein